MTNEVILEGAPLDIDSFFRWNESWVDHVESGSRKHGYGLLLSTFLFYTLTIVGLVLCFVFYAPNLSECRLHTFLISTNAILCLLLSILSILPWVREYNSSCGLLQSSFVSLYVTYYTWSAMINNPNEVCNPNIRLFVRPANASSKLQSHRQENLSDPATLVALIVYVCALLYSIVTTSRNNRAKKLFLSSSSFSVDASILDDAQLVNSISDSKWSLGSEEENRQRVYDDERGSVTYSYSLFHFMFMLGSLYAMMALTKYVDRETWECHRPFSLFS